MNAEILGLHIKKKIPTFKVPHMELIDLHFVSGETDLRHTDVYVSALDLSMVIVFNAKEYHKKHRMLFDSLEELTYYYEEIKKQLSFLSSYTEHVYATPIYFEQQLKKVEELTHEELIAYIKSGSTDLATNYDKYFFDQSILNLDVKKLYQTHYRSFVFLDKNNVFRTVHRETKTYVFSGFHHLKTFDKSYIDKFLIKNKESIISFLQKEKIEYVQKIGLYVGRILNDLISVELEIKYIKHHDLPIN